MIAARAAALRPFIGSTREQRLATLRRLLRQERRAARSGLGYDPSRHAALRRLVAELELPSRSNPDGAGTSCKEKGRHAKHSGLTQPSFNFRPRGN
ncbi:hypothetical protein ACO2RV_01915 [Ancylobacter sp. VNQ12]|uniref:hypothetical protein n=1 Tax=Ancylobacter sp. VNQ12 TaxID=3400920 RepID=UPI003C08D62E